MLPPILQRRPYICGPLTELDPKDQDRIKVLYSKLGDMCERVFGIRAFVPHEHYDPVKHRDFTPTQVDQAERRQVCQGTSLLVVVPIAPSWGGGIEVEMAHRSDVPVILLCEKIKLEKRLISRLLLGNPAIIETIVYTDFDEAAAKFAVWVMETRHKFD